MLNDVVVDEEKVVINNQKNLWNGKAGKEVKDRLRRAAELERMKHFLSCACFSLLPLPPVLASLSSAGVPTLAYLSQAVRFLVQSFSLAQLLGHDILAPVVHVLLKTFQSLLYNSSTSSDGMPVSTNGWIHSLPHMHVGKNKPCAVPVCMLHTHHLIRKVNNTMLEGAEAVFL